MGVDSDWNLLWPEDIAGSVFGPAFVVSNNQGVPIIFGTCLMRDLFVAAKVLSGLNASSIGER